MQNIIDIKSIIIFQKKINLLFKLAISKEYKMLVKIMVKRHRSLDKL